MSRISREGSRVIIHVSVRPKQEKNYPLSIPHDPEHQENIETSNLSLNTIYVTHKRDPFSTRLEAIKYRKKSSKKRRKCRRRCGFYLWLLCVLYCCLMALLAILAALLLSLSRKQSTSTVTTTTSTSTTSITTTSITTTSTTTTSTTTSTTTTTTTTTTHKDCLSLNILNGTAYPGYDIISKAVSTYIECCEWCFVTPTCVVFTVRLPEGGGGCFLKNSTAGGISLCSYCISASI